MVYVQGFINAVPAANKQALIVQGKQVGEKFKALGATRYVECWGDDVPKGKLTDFHMAVKARDDEIPVFSWVEFPDKQTYESASRAMSQDPEIMNMNMPFDGMRMVFGGFEVIVDT
jgi:uncharacterized protein YbaA (DUF1428 family)